MGKEALEKLAIEEEDGGYQLRAPLFLRFFYLVTDRIKVPCSKELFLHNIIYTQSYILDNSLLVGFEWLI